MSKSAVTQRLISARSGVSTHRMRTGRLGERDYAAIIGACNQLHEAPLYVDDTPGLTILALRARARRLVAQRGVKAIMVDYLQLLTAPGSARESRQVEVSAISRGVKALARELNIPVICLSQLNRGPESRDRNTPRLSDLRESGSLEQDADVVVLLHREEYYHIGDPDWEMDNPDKVGVAELIIAKQRNGPTGTVKLVWDAEVTRFRNYAHASRGPNSTAANTPHTPRVEYGQSVRGNPAAPASGGGGAGGGGGFPAGRQTGPVDGFRDGGGPERDEDEAGSDDIAPF